jgi:glycyl-tRNA synthetase alpha chain
MDGMEITQFTYFQQAGGQELSPVAAELTYGLERITMFITGHPEHLRDPVARRAQLRGSAQARGIRALDLRLRGGGPRAPPEALRAVEGECRALLDRDPPLLYPAYDYALRCSHTFNLLDARGVISITERAAYIQRIRGLAVRCASRYVALRREAGFPLLPEAERGKALAATATAAAASGAAGERA